MKKFVFLFFLVFLAWCNFVKKQNEEINKFDTKSNIQFDAVYTWKFIKWILVAVTDPHKYSKTWPLLISGSYYFDPYNFYYFNKNLYTFMKAYSSWFDWKQVFYYDENNWAQAGLVVYVLRKIYHKKNVSLWQNPPRKMLKQWLAVIPVKNILTSKFDMATWWYIWTWKYLVVYDPKLIHFKSGDLLLYSCDRWTMKLDEFYKNATWINIKSFYWSKLINIDWSLKSRKEIENLLKPLHLEKYKRVFIYYPKYRYRSWFLALYLSSVK